MKLVSIIIPVYNHEKIIVKNMKIVISKLKELHNIHYEIILINDGSSDSSQTEIEKIAGENITIISKKNGGLGSVLKKGFQTAKGDIIIYLDLDLSYKIDNLHTMLNLANKWDCVVCSKYSINNKYPAWRKFLSYLHFLFIKYFFNIPVRDTGSGLVMVKSHFVKGNFFLSHGFGIHLELFLLLRKQNAKIKEISIDYIHHPGSFRIFFHSLQTLREISKLAWRFGFIDSFL